MLNAQTTQFTLADDGTISFQSDASNPMPGDPVAMVLKGKTALDPLVQLLDTAPGEDKALAQAAVQTWLKTHVATVLAPLLALFDGEDLPETVVGIAAQLFSAMGVLPREEVEDLISALDQDTRRVLRSKKVRLGPILIFQPDLNKPAAVRLRALLWSLYNDKPLPAPVPKDGVVSCAVDGTDVDQDFYRAIGYPLYGGRAIRIDMLDRVISAVYDGAEGGKFKAEHKMAEWLGCSIEGLYAILEAMGHKKVFDPADVVPVESSDVTSAEAVADVLVEDSAPKAEVEVESAEPAVSESKSADVKAKPQEQVKPELATFRLKKGKAFEKAVARKKPEKKPEKTKGKRNKKTSHTPRVMSTGPERKLEDSPFAILGQLKDQGSEKKDAG